MKNIATALCKAQLELKNPDQNAKGYGYKYADLPSIIDQVKPVLAKHGLALTQLAMDDGNGRVGVHTLLLHDSGEKLESKLTLPIPEMKGNTVTQQAGAAITYARRYAISAILNIASEEDTDARKEKSAAGESSAQSKTSYQNNTTTSSDPATKAQVEKLKVEIGNTGEDYEYVKSKIREHLGLETLKRLTKSQASEAIKFVMNRGKAH